MTSYDESLLLKVPADYDVNKIGFILLDDDSASDASMEIDLELTPGQQKPTIPPTMCHICSRVYMNRSNLRRHLNTVHSNRTFECLVCKRSFTKQRQFSFHLRSHQTKENYICDTCGKQENTKNALKQHLEVHQGLPDFDMDLDMLLDF